MGHVAQSVWQFVATNWGCVSFVGLLGYLLGSIVTRKIMAPAFCPQCLRQKNWQEQLQRDLRKSGKKPRTDAT